jgi:hypothetical protein
MREYDALPSFQIQLVSLTLYPSPTAIYIASINVKSVLLIVFCMNYFRIHSIILAFRYFSFWVVVPYLCHPISLIFGYQQ